MNTETTKTVIIGGGQGPWRLRDGTEVLIRPIAPEDEPLIAAFHAQLSERSVYFRYFYAFPLERRVVHDRLSRICFPDYDREMVLVVEGGPAEGREIFQ
jgi:acetyltransferase